MFTAKKTSLFETTTSKKQTTSVSTMTVPNQPFIRHGIEKSSETMSGNLSKKYVTSGSNFVDQFASVSRYRDPRSFEDVSNDMRILWAQNSLLALGLLFYIRTITRVVQLFDGSKTKTVQRGQGLKHEGIFRFIWVAVNYPDTFWKNIDLFISVGSWKDIFVMLSYDLQYNGWSGRKLDWKKFGQVILAGLENPSTTNLVRKYLPQIKTNSRCRTLESQADNIIAKWICSLLFGETDSNGSTYKKYRKLKSSGTAHEWQQLISQEKFLEIDFDSIHGRALSLLVSGKFLKNQKLESRYEEWITSRPVAKFTGFVHELIQGKVYSALTSYQKHTINAQFNQLVEVAKKNLSTQGIRPISVLDCSGSMSSRMYIGNGKVGTLKSIEVAFSSAIFFNEMIGQRSPFKDFYLAFSNGTEMHQFHPGGFVDKYFNTQRRGWGGTNFASVFQFLADFKRKNPHVSEELIPNFIVVFSDGEFDFVLNNKHESISNVEAGRIILRDAGFSRDYYENFGMCFVDLPNNFYYAKPSVKFEAFADTKNVFYFSGYDLSPLAFLFGVEGKTMESIPKTADELFLAAMDQEILNMLTI